MSNYILPLYSHRDRCVKSKSGLNASHASQKKRPRDSYEVYIPIPKAFYDSYGNPFPDGTFNLVLPSGKKLEASICQQDSKSLMTKPNTDLGYWILNELGNVAGTVITNSHLTIVGFDTVKLTKDKCGDFHIDVNRVPNEFETLMGKAPIF